MNAERLRGIIQFLLAKEAEIKMQENLTKFREAVSQLAAAPADAARQSVVVQTLGQLQATVRALTGSLTQAEMKDIVDVRAYDFFSNDIIRRIEELYRQNGVTPAVLDKEIGEFANSRQQYLDKLNAVLASFDAVGVQAESLEPGQAELEVVIPQSLFDNDLGNFQEELRILHRMIRTLSEVANVTPGPIEIKQISTTDPTLFLGLDVTALVLIGLAIQWGIGIIKSTIEIKRLITAARTATLDQTVVTAIEGQIHQKIERAITEEVDALLTDFHGGEGRKNELKGTLASTLDQLLQRIERGMILEIRLLAPRPPAADASAEAQSRYQEFERLAQIANSLEFPRVEGQPALQLTRPNSDRQQNPE
jgi:hypothetical protein